MLYLLFGSENLVKLTLSGANYKDFEVVISLVNLQELEIQKLEKHLDLKNIMTSLQ